MINKYFNFQSNEQKILIDKIKRKNNFLKIKNLVDGFSKLKVLVIGEVIIDKYVFCEALGKSGKEPMLVLRNIKTEEYLGGSAAISKHLSEFTKKVTLYGMIGDQDNYFHKIRKEIPKKINFSYLKKKNSPTIIKKRFLDNIGNKKVLGVYNINDSNLGKSDEKNLKNIYQKI